MNTFWRALCFVVVILIAIGFATGVISGSFQLIFTL